MIWKVEIVTRKIKEDVERKGMIVYKYPQGSIRLWTAFPSPVSSETQCS